MSTVSALLLSLTLAAAPNSRGEVIDFSASWCAPCQQVAPIVAKLEQAGHPIRTIDVDRDTAMKDKYQISSMPTFVLVVDGREVERHLGKMTEQQILQMLAKIPKPEAVSNVSMERSSLQRSRPYVADPNVDLGVARPFDKELFADAGRPAPINPSVTPAAPDAAPRKRSLWPFGKKDPKLETVDVRAIEVRASDEPLGEVSLQIPEGQPADPMDASVLLRVTVGNQIHLGSGTIIYSVKGVARIVTCGHIFRGITEDSRIEVDLLHGATKQTVLGRAIGYDIESEIGLIEIPSNELLPAATVATTQSAPNVGDRVQSIGGDGGARPTSLPIEVTDLDRYVGASTIECTGVPVQGRSGGGLFNRQGELIGVCFAADPEGKHGIYTGLSVVHTALKAAGMTRLYELQVPSGQPEESLIADSQDAPDLSGLFGSAPESRASEALNSDRDDSGSPAVALDDRDSRRDDVAATGEVPRATGSLDALGSMAEEAEIVCIIRPKNQPEGASRVVIINQASPKLLSYLRGDALGEPSTDTMRVHNSPSTPADLTAPLSHRRYASAAQPRPASLDSRLAKATATRPTEVAETRMSKANIISTAATISVQPTRYVRSDASRHAQR